MSRTAPEDQPVPNGPTASGGEDFIAEVSHELRAPVAALVAAAETLAGRWEGLTDEQRRQLVSVLLSRSRRLSHLVVELLELSRLAADVPPAPGTDGLPAPSGSVPVDPVVRAAADDAGAVGVVIDAPADVVVAVDADRLRRILVNLLLNAVEHGSPPVVVEADGRDGQVEIRVIDHGPGVTAELEPRLFLRFSRETPVPGRPVPDGAGLGLAIVEALARRAGGSAFYRPGPAGGAIFGVRLPSG